MEAAEQLDTRPTSCGETAEQQEQNGIVWRRAIERGQPVYWREVMVADDGELRRCRYQESVIEGEARYGEPEWTQAKITDDGRVFTRARGDHPWRPWRSGRSQGHAPRRATNSRTGGSRRGTREATGSGDRAGPDDPDESDPDLAAGRTAADRLIPSPAGWTSDQPKRRRVPVTSRILAELKRAGYRTLPSGDMFSMLPSAWTRPGPLIGLPQGFTYVELAQAVYENPEPSAAQVKTVQRAAKRLIEAGLIEQQSRRSDGVVVSRIPTDADHEFRARLLREHEEREERSAAEAAAAKQDATGYLDEAGVTFDGVGGVRIESVLVIAEDGVELREAA